MPANRDNRERTEIYSREPVDSIRESLKDKYILFQYHPRTVFQIEDVKTSRGDLRIIVRDQFTNLIEQKGRT